MSEDWIEQNHIDLVGLWEAAAFHVVEAYDVVVGPAWRIELDVQPYAEIWLIQEGRCAVESGERRAIAEAGEVVFLPPGPRRVSATASDDLLVLSGFGCSLQLLDGVDLMGRIRPPLVLAEPSTPLVRAIENAVRASRSDPVGRVFRTRAWAELAIAELMSAAALPLDAEQTDSLRPEVSEALTYIDSHYAEPLDTRRLAAAVHLSPQHLTRCFNSSLGVPPMTYLRRRRLNLAREELIRADRPVTHIMRSVGFTDPSGFSRAFKRQFGFSPTALRELARSGSQHASLVAPGADADVGADREHGEERQQIAARE